MKAEDIKFGKKYRYKKAKYFKGKCSILSVSTLSFEKKQKYDNKEWFWFLAFYDNYIVQRVPFNESGLESIEEIDYLKL